MTEKVCKNCLIKKSILEFHFYAPGKASGKCKPCHVDHERKRQQALWDNDPEYRERHNLAGKLYRKGLSPSIKPVEVKGNEKKCKVCDVIKPLIDFPLNSNKHRLKTCSICYRENENLKDRTKYREDPDHRARKLLAINKSFLKTRYSTTPEEVLKTLEKQDHKCANPECGTVISLTAPKEFAKQAVIDHDHATGKFRALLCQRCNLMLGYLENYPTFVESLREYLHEHSSSSH